MIDLWLHLLPFSLLIIVIDLLLLKLPFKSTMITMVIRLFKPQLTLIFLNSGFTANQLLKPLFHRHKVLVMRLVILLKYYYYITHITQNLNSILSLNSFTLLNISIKELVVRLTILVKYRHKVIVM